jgi:hypothetical protein
MFAPLARRLLATLAAALAPACTQDNPLFVPASEDDATTVSASPTTSDEPIPTTSEPGSSGSGEASSSGTVPGTTAQASSTTDPIDTSTTDPIDTSTTAPPDTSTTGPIEPVEQVVNVPATVATCVLLPIFNLNLFYLGPPDCEYLAEQSTGIGEVGVMVLDQGFVPAAGRQSRVYLSFAIPAAPPDTQLQSATLILEASASLDAGANWSGDLFLSDDPFTMDSLNEFAPGGSFLVLDPGPSFPGQPSSWQIPFEVIKPDNDLFLGLGSLDTNGVLYRSNGASPDKRPRLELVYL